MEETMDTRTRMMLGDDGVDRLHQATVAVFGVGGVGSFAGASFFGLVIN